MDDLIHFGSLSAQTRRAWEAYAQREEFLDETDELRCWMLTSQAASLFFLLRNAPDDPNIFPKGKSASLQVFETLIDRAFNKKADTP